MVSLPIEGAILANEMLLAGAVQIALRHTSTLLDPIPDRLRQ
jgi:hypothetical protein